jgi:hypothetical protein
LQSAFDQEVSETLCDPTHAGIGFYPRLVSDEEWIAGAKHVIEDRGLDFFLPTLLAALHESFGCPDIVPKRIALLGKYAEDGGDLWEWFAGLLPGPDVPEVFVRMLCNPAHTGVGQRPRIMSDEQWMKNARRVVAEKGADYFLALLLDSLRRSSGMCSP